MLPSLTHMRAHIHIHSHTFTLTHTHTLTLCSLTCWIGVSTRALEELLRLARVRSEDYHYTLSVSGWKLQTHNVILCMIGCLDLLKILCACACVCDSNFLLISCTKDENWLRIGWIVFVCFRLSSLHVYTYTYTQSKKYTMKVWEICCRRWEESLGLILVLVYLAWFNGLYVEKV